MFLILALLVPTLAGCLRIQASMGVSANDRVTGQIIAAVIPKNAEDTGPQLTPPSAIAGKSKVVEYHQDGYVGSQIFFNDLTFGEVEHLRSLSDRTTGVFHFSLSRNGDIVQLRGEIDLRQVTSPETQAQFTIAFPARITSTNGNRDNDSKVSWRFPPGEITSIEAEVHYADPSTRSFAGWIVIIGGIGVAVAMIVGVLAWLQWRNTSVAELFRSPADLKTRTAKSDAQTTTVADGLEPSFLADAKSHSSSLNDST